jgi:hypothetical protein
MSSTECAYRDERAGIMGDEKPPDPKGARQINRVSNAQSAYRVMAEAMHDSYLCDFHVATNVPAIICGAKRRQVLRPVARGPGPAVVMCLR